MIRRVFFSFHYERDIWRASIVRNSWVTKPDREVAGFIDAAAWEEVKKKGEDAIKRWIDKELEGTSVTVVLIGKETSERKYVQYEMIKSFKKGNGLFGIYIHKLKDQYGQIDIRGPSPFGRFYIDPATEKLIFLPIYPTYDWIDNDGYNNLGDWIERAARLAGR